MRFRTKPISIAALYLCTQIACLPLFAQTMTDQILLKAYPTTDWPMYSGDYSSSDIPSSVKSQSPMPINCSPNGLITSRT